MPEYLLRLCVSRVAAGTRRRLDAGLWWVQTHDENRPSFPLRA